MFVARNISRVARLAPGQTPALKRAAPASQRSLTISYPYFKANLVSENQVPATVYSPEGKMHAAIPVRPEDRIGPAVPVTNEMVHLTTLSDESFQMLPATVKSMTVKGKVIIVTGYVYGSHHFSSYCLTSILLWPNHIRLIRPSFLT